MTEPARNPERIIREAREDIEVALASGAERPRVRRETAEVCEQFLHDAGAGDARR